MRQVIAIGGGGFGRTQASNLIEQYILDQVSTKSSPNICFIPTATGDLDPYVVNFYSVFSKLDCEPSHISFFKRTIDTPKVFFSALSVKNLAVFAIRKTNMI